jgi:hypothetical protein
MEHLPPGTWTVLGSIPDTGRQAREKAVLDPAVSETTIELQFGGGLTLTGRALLGEDPVKGATLFAQGTDVNHSSWGRTGADGTFRMEGLEAGTYRVELQQFDTGLSYGETVEVKTDRDVTLKVPTAKIIGRIVDSADNRPVAGVSVVLQGREGSDTGRTLLPRGATSDLTGRFEVANVTNGSWTLKADKSGYAAGTADVDVDNGHAPDNTRISLDPTDGVALEVKLPSGRVPDTIDAAVLDSSGRVLTGGSYATGENGRVRLTSIPPGSWDVVVSAAGSGTVNVRVNVPGQTVVVPLPPACALSLSVPALAGSTAAATATITGSDGKTFRSLGWMADTMSQWRLSNGKVEVDALPPGNWTLQVAASDGRTWSGSSSTQPDRAAQVVLQ